MSVLEDIRQNHYQRKHKFELFAQNNTKNSFKTTNAIISASIFASGHCCDNGWMSFEGHCYLFMDVTVADWTDGMVYNKLTWLKGELIG